jgi:histidine triad (HIT) family protein
MKHPRSVGVGDAGHEFLWPSPNGKDDGMTDCVFCSIVAGALPAHAVMDDDDTCFAFLDQRPVFKGHVLLVPRAHHETLADQPPDVVGPLFVHAQRLARAVEDGLGAAGSFVAINNRVSQSVPHVHVHVVPRRFKDGLRGFFWPRTRYDTDEEMADYAARLRAALTR